MRTATRNSGSEPTLAGVVGSLAWIAGSALVLGAISCSDPIATPILAGVGVAMVTIGAWWNGKASG